VLVGSKLMSEPNANDSFWGRPKLNDIKNQEATISCSS